jgi:hypothetical protein
MFMRHTDTELAQQKQPNRPNGPIPISSVFLFNKVLIYPRISSHGHYQQLSDAIQSPALLVDSEPQLWTAGLGVSSI